MRPPCPMVGEARIGISPEGALGFEARFARTSTSGRLASLAPQPAGDSLRSHLNQRAARFARTSTSGEQQGGVPELVPEVARLHGCRVSPWRPRPAGGGLDAEPVRRPRV